MKRHISFLTTRGVIHRQAQLLYSFSEGFASYLSLKYSTWLCIWQSCRLEFMRLKCDLSATYATWNCYERRILLDAEISLAKSAYCDTNYQTATMTDSKLPNQLFTISDCGFEWNPTHCLYLRDFRHVCFHRLQCTYVLCVFINASRPHLGKLMFF